MGRLKDELIPAVKVFAVAAAVFIVALSLILFEVFYSDALFFFLFFWLFLGPFFLAPLFISIGILMGRRGGRHVQSMAEVLAAPVFALIGVYLLSFLDDLF